MLARYYRSRGWTKIALMTTTDASGQQFEAFFNEALTLPENKSLTIVAREHWAPADLNVTAQAERIKAADPQAMIGWSAGTPTGTLLRGLHDAGIDIPIACGNGNMIYTQLAQYASFLPSQLYFPGRLGRRRTHRASGGSDHDRQSDRRPDDAHTHERARFPNECDGIIRG
jgi:branched-chain amino acid transport system substrate-binding protein